MSRYDAIETYEHNGLMISIFHDLDCESPRENDNLGTIATWHRRGRYGDVQPNSDPAEYIASLPKGTISLPVYMYEHSGIALNTGGFSCPWDSGQLGVIWIDPAKVRKEWSVKRISAKLRAKVIECLKSEVDEYSKYCNGECYGYVVADPNGEEIDSCWGFIGWEWVKQEAEESADNELAGREAARVADREMRDDG